MNGKCTRPPSTTAKIRRATSTDGTRTGTIILGKYQLVRLLGRGSFAKVYHGHYLDDNNTNIAIKAIDKKSTIIDASMEPRIINEISAMCRLNHPNIIQLNEVMATKSKIYLVMEIASGGDLQAKLNRHGRFSEPTARFYFHQLVSALHYCHQNGITHRDIKPQNILLDQKNNLKISDFGLSALPEQLKNGLLHTACGTPAYTAPEVAYRKGYDGEKADSWSCGVILFVFLSGFLPFDDTNIPNMYRAMHRRVFQFPDWVSKPARGIIYKLLDPNPSTRLSIEQLMKLSWFKKSGGQLNHHQKLDLDEFEKDRNNLVAINAFDIISMSSGLNLSGLFESDLRKKEMKFTTSARVEEVEDKLMKIGGERGYKVERGKGMKGRGIGMVKGRVVLMVEILEVAMELLLVEVKVVNNGGLEFEDSQIWEEMKFGMKDFVVSMYNDGS